MVFPETLIEMRINAPKPHQRIISKLTTGLGYLFYRQRKIPIEPLPETMIDEGQTSPTPDIILYDNEKAQTPIIIEVCHTTGFKNDFNKVQKLIDDYEYGIIEGFVYNYLTEQWRKYKKEQGEILENPSYSEILALDLNSLL